MKFILFLVKSAFVDATYSEIYGEENVLLYKEMNHSLINTIRNIHTSMKLNKRFRIPFQGIWKHTYFEEKKLSEDDECVFLFEEGNKQSYDADYLMYIRRKYKKAILIFLYWNPAEYIDKRYVSYVNQHFDYVISFDPEDCKKHGWIHYSGIYSKPEGMTNRDNPEYDVFFAGHNKGRLELLRNIYAILKNAGLKCDFYISEVEDCSDDGIHYNEYLPYSEILEHIKNSKAILEVLQDCQHGSTLRLMEAMVYERVLITNNTNVFSERYFSEEQFYVFNGIESIDVEEIKNKCDSVGKFSYNNLLSPKKFLAFLEELYENFSMNVS